MTNDQTLRGWPQPFDKNQAQMRQRSYPTMQEIMQALTTDYAASRSTDHDGSRDLRDEFDPAFDDPFFGL